MSIFGRVSSNQNTSTITPGGVVSSMTNDQCLNKEVGHSFTISDELLGQGSFGKVFVATDEKTQKVAVKCCNIDSTGIPNILEASIMSSIMHPYINKAHRILASPDKLYIIQELAVSDLAQYTRREKDNITNMR